MFQWKTLALKIDARTERERGLLFAVVLSVLLLLSMQFVISPLLKQQTAINQKIQQNSTLMETLTKELSHLQNTQHADVNAGIKLQLAEHKKMLAVRDEKLLRFQKSLVASDKIDLLLESILKKNQHLRLVSLKSFPVADVMNGETKLEQVLASPASSSAASSEQKLVQAPQRGLFKHEVEIVVEGNYLDMLAYLKNLEAMPERLYWSRSNLQVLEYPKSRLSLRVFTLSLERKWLDL